MSLKFVIYITYRVSTMKFGFKMKYFHNNAFNFSQNNYREINCWIHYQTLQTVKNYRKKIRKRKKDGISKQIESEKHQGFNFQESNAVLERFNQKIQM